MAPSPILGLELTIHVIKNPNTSRETVPLKCLDAFRTPWTNRHFICVDVTEVVTLTDLFEAALAEDLAEKLNTIWCLFCPSYFLLCSS
jgi:hypothetical protein